MGWISITFVSCGYYTPVSRNANRPGEGAVMSALTPPTFTQFNAIIIAYVSTDSFAVNDFEHVHAGPLPDAAWLRGLLVLGASLRCMHLPAL